MNKELKNYFKNKYYAKENTYWHEDVPIGLYNEIKSLKIQSIDGYIFTFCQSALYSILRKFKISAHCFRHTYASNMLNKGVNIKVVADLLGDTLDTVIKTYIQTPT
ncbi:hypothetical protein HMPREF9629_00858 [Peptoanaerobacter stomatis]|uniref:Tyr recombinase domain-containing protein n=1 Tax=Peptoanaerobacter stomatis TaxID=796937 RepID=G9X3A1_9FIRM|nr:site-specific integrase [Peptoanaerobacter stomatis]EHL10643.1 hypothetical protein HMPREF9629_00858 [Peptoanaerobacter stomatis]